MAKSETKSSFGKPGAVAVARSQAGGDLCAALLLYRLKWYFDPKHKSKKLQRHGREWIAMSRLAWAVEAGLTEAEMKNRALPKLRKMDFVEIRQMCLTPNTPKLLWMSLDLAKLNEATLPSDMLEHFPAGEKVFGAENPTTNYPYKKADP